MGAPPDEQSFIANYLTIVVNGYQIIGSIVGGYKHTKEMLEFSAQHAIEPLCEFFEWDDFPKALDKLEKGKPLFRCVVKVDEISKNFRNY